MKDPIKPKYIRGKKPVKVRKPSRPLDGINHRLLKEQAEKEPAIVEAQQTDAPPTREEMIIKATELGLSFNKRTSDETLLNRINDFLKGK